MARNGGGRNRWSRRSFTANRGCAMKDWIRGCCRSPIGVAALVSITLLGAFGAFSWLDRELLPYDDAILVMRFMDLWQQDGRALGWLQYIEGETGNVWPFVVLALLEALGIKSYATFLAFGQTVIVANAIVVVFIARRVYVRWPYATLAGVLTLVAPGQLEGFTWAVPIQHSVSVLIFLILLLALLHTLPRGIGTLRWWISWCTLLIASAIVWTLREPIAVAVIALLAVVLVGGPASTGARARWLVVLALAGGAVLAAIGLTGRLGSQLERALNSVCPTEIRCLDFGAVPFTTLIALTVGWMVIAGCAALFLARGSEAISSADVPFPVLRFQEVWRGVTMVLILAACSVFAASGLMVALSTPLPLAQTIMESRWLVATAPLAVPVAVASACLLMVWKSQRLIFWLLVSVTWAAAAIYLSDFSKSLPVWGGDIEAISNPLVLTRYSVYFVPLFALALVGTWWSPTRRKYLDPATGVLAILVLIAGGASLMIASVERLSLVTPLVADEVVYTFNRVADKAYVVCPTHLTVEYLRSVNADFGKQQGWADLNAGDILALEPKSPAVKALLDGATPVARDKHLDTEMLMNLCVRIEQRNLR